MTIIEINKLRPGEEFDELIARHIMKWGEDAIENNNIPIPEYSSDRGCAVNVIDAISFISDDARIKFDKCIEKYMTEMTKMLGICRPSDFLRYLTPDEICRAALKAMI